jgi:hypothetical protein
MHLTSHAGTRRTSFKVSLGRPAIPWACAADGRIDATRQTDRHNSHLLIKPPLTKESLLPRTVNDPETICPWLSEDPMGTDWNTLKGWTCQWSMFERPSSPACVVSSCVYTGTSSSSRWNSVVCIRYVGESFITEPGVHSEVSKRTISFHEEHSSLTFVRLARFDDHRQICLSLWRLVAPV